MKRICIVVPPNLPMPPVKGGAIETLMQYIAEMNENEGKFDITFISLWNCEAKRLSSQYKNSTYIYYHWKRIDNIKWFIFRVIRKITKINVDFLEPYEYFVTKYVLKNSFDIFINESADFNAFKKISLKMGRENCYAHLHSEFPSNKIIDNTFGKIITVSDYIKKQWMKTSLLKDEDIVVLKNCADTSRFSVELSNKDKILLRTRLNLDEEDFVVYFCGRIVPQKGILELINAIISIKDERVKLLIIGSPNFGNQGKKTEYLKNVEEKVEKHSSRIIFTGYIDNSELYKYYSISNCVVVPSTYEDPAPLVPIESLAAGKALIVTNTGGAPEYVADNSGIIVKKEENLEKQLQDSILKVKNNNVLRNSLEDAAKNRAKLFTKEKYYSDFCNIIYRK